MRLTTAAIVLGVGMMLITALVGRDPVFFVLPADLASLSNYNSQELWKTLVCVIGAGMTVVAVAIKLFGTANARHRAGR